ncbi:MAG: LysE family translocator [Hyphomicrobiaceae bacterium]|nr:LysE family translocator [Hyphomicrobiaceae bacterium]
MISPEFLITALIVVLAPGTGVVYTLAVGIGRGRLASAFAAFGCTLGILPHIAAALLGVAALLHTSAVLFQIFKFAGAAYLVYLAIQVLRDRGTLSISPRRDQKSLFQIVRTGFLINILNPKLSVFFLAFLPQFAPAGRADTLFHMLVLSAIFMLMTFAVFVVYGQFAGLARDYVLACESVMAWFRRLTALAFGAMGLRLALSEA